MPRYGVGCGPEAGTPGLQSLSPRERRPAERTLAGQSRIPPGGSKGQTQGLARYPFGLRIPASYFHCVSVISLTGFLIAATGPITVRAAAVTVPADGVLQNDDQLSGSLTNNPSYAFPDPVQEKFAQSLANFEISIPSRVSSSGQFLSHAVRHKVRIPSSRRRRNADSSIKVNQDDLETPVHYSITIDNTDFQLSLLPNHKLFAPGFVVERRTHRFGNLSDVRVDRALDHMCHFQGSIHGRPGSTVAVATCNGLHGLISSNEGDYFIEPVRGHNPDLDETQPHLIYKRSALPSEHDIAQAPRLNSHHDNKAEPCGQADDINSAWDARDAWEEKERQRRQQQLQQNQPQQQQQQQQQEGDHTRRTDRKKRSISLERNVEVLVVVDPKMMQYYRDDNVEVYVFTVMNMVSAIYHDSSIGNAINIVLVRLMLLEQDEQGLSISHHAENTLASFCKWQDTINNKDEKHPNHHDVAVLLTRYNICSRMNKPCSTLGLSQVFGMCQPHRTCNINEDTGLAVTYTVAHELGHNFGMQHDKAENGCPAGTDKVQHLMAAQLSFEAEPFEWSNCSRQAVTSFFDRDWGFCLDDEPADHDFPFPSLPPGILYDVNHQCQLQYGRNAEHCTGIDDVCRTLWCQADNKCLTRLEAAAEGTICGDNKWCTAGRCETIGEKPKAIDGEWGEWIEWSACTRSCGAGVSLASRHCDHPPPSDGGNYCLGERRRYRICNTESCPEGSINFRQVQCSKFNTIPYKRKVYEWEFIASPIPCQLHCKAKGEFFSVMLNDTVVDGTPCRLGRKDICISGRCRSVGCDWVIDSSSVEDSCGVCHGDGSTCKTVKSQFSKKVGLGYVEAMVIPEGARHIRVEEIAEANNYLAVKNDQGHYYLNGHWFIQWSGDYEAAGTVINYRRDGNLETFSAPGPLKESLHIMLLFQSQNPGVKFEFTVPKAESSESRKLEFHWRYMDWTHCTVSCGGGTQRSAVVCVEQETGMVDDRYCNISTKPDDMQRMCNEHLCPARWWNGPWQHCSRTCGNDGVHHRTVLCIRSQGPNEQVALDDGDCDQANKPQTIEQCHRKAACPDEWIVGGWSDTCDGDPCSLQTRDVHCNDVNALCDIFDKPADKRECGNDTCGHWHMEPWSHCTRPCGGGIQYRQVRCIDGQSCSKKDRPMVVQSCNKESCYSINATMANATYTGSPTVNTTLSSPVASTKSIASTWSSPNYLKTKSGPLSSSTSGDLHAQHRSTVDMDVGIKGNTDSATNHPFASTTPSSADSLATSTSKPSDSQNKKSPSISHNDYKMNHNVMLGDDPNLGATNNKSESVIPKRGSNSTNPYVDEGKTNVGQGELSEVPVDELKYSGDHQPKDGEGRVKFEVTTTMKPPPQAVELLDRTTHKWMASFWTRCSNRCGAGIQKRNILCVELATMKGVEVGHCKAQARPRATNKCIGDRCVPWLTSDWTQCSVTCGIGAQSRQVTCPIPGECDSNRKPPSEQSCDLAPCLKWLSGPWSECTVTCGGGKQYRHVQCITELTKQPATQCSPASRPIVVQSCNDKSCPGLNTGHTQQDDHCHSDVMSYQVCKALRKMGQCRQPYVQAKCCRTCRQKPEARKQLKPISAA